MHICRLLTATLVLLSSCHAFKPSADLKTFSSNFIADSKDSALLAGKVRVTFFGTSTLLFDDGETQLLIDGFFSRPSAYNVVLGKVSSDTTIINSVIRNYHINRLQGIFVCHSHYDHAMDAPEVSKVTGAKVYGSASTINICKGEKLAENRMQLFKAEQEISIGNFSVTVLHSKHTPPFRLFGKTNATDPNHPDIIAPLKQPAKVEEYIEGGTYDFYIKHGEHKMLVKASTNYIEGALNDYPADVFFLGTAMLGVQSITFQNNYYQNTVQATGAKTIIPLHWDNFTKPLSNPLEALPNLTDNVDSGFHFLLKKTQEDKIDFKLMQSGTSTILF